MYLGGHYKRGADRRGNFILAIQLTALISARTFLWT